MLGLSRFRINWRLWQPYGEAVDNLIVSEFLFAWIAFVNIIGVDGPVFFVKRDLQFRYAGDTENRCNIFQIEHIFILYARRQGRMLDLPSLRPWSWQIRK